MFAHAQEWCSAALVPGADQAPTRSFQIQRLSVVTWTPKSNTWGIRLNVVCGFNRAHAVGVTAEMKQ